MLSSVWPGLVNASCLPRAALRPEASSRDVDAPLRHPVKCQAVLIQLPRNPSDFRLGLRRRQHDVHLKRAPCGGRGGAARRVWGIGDLRGQGETRDLLFRRPRTDGCVIVVRRGTAWVLRDPVQSEATLGMCWLRGRKNRRLLPEPHGGGGGRLHARLPEVGSRKASNGGGVLRM